jgi:hypothetical protein
MLAAEERSQLRAALKLIDNAYSMIVAIAGVRGQEPAPPTVGGAGWRSDDTADDGTLYWEGRRREK